MKHTEQLVLFETCHSALKSHESKLCPKCFEVKPLEHFPWKSGNHVFRRENCRSCEKHLNRVRLELREKHGMPDDNYICPICNKNSEEVGKKGGQHAGNWALDHCHETQEFRGWLCHLCNRALGCFKDDIPSLQRAITYLKGNNR